MCNTQYGKQALHMVSTWFANGSGVVPIFASPIMLHSRSGHRYSDGLAPRIAHMFEESLTSVRMVDKHANIFLLVNFVPHAKDRRLLEELRVTVLDAERYSRKVVSLLHRFLGACPINAGFAHATLLRYFYLLGAMLENKMSMAFVLEGDNLLLRPVSYLAQAYGISEPRGDDGVLFDASPVHVSLHSSFVSVDFVRAMVEVTTRLAEFGRTRLGRCFVDGGGQDMRLTYEAAFELHRKRRLHGGGPARIVNGAGGALPCRFTGRPFVDALTSYCSTGKDKLGPCAIHSMVVHFRASEGTLDTTDLPLLYECVPSASWQPNDKAPNGKQAAVERTARRLQVPGAMQLNLKGPINHQSPGLCSSVSCSGVRLGEKAPLSRVFACPASWITSGQQHNKQLVFYRGRVLSPLKSGRDGVRDEDTTSPRWFEHFNLHFQGGECKAQMRPTLAAIERSRKSRFALSCENATSRDAYDECLHTGSGEVTVMMNYA